MACDFSKKQAGFRSVLKRYQAPIAQDRITHLYAVYFRQCAAEGADACAMCLDIRTDKIVKRQDRSEFLKNTRGPELANETWQMRGSHCLFPIRSLLLRSPARWLASPRCCRIPQVAAARPIRAIKCLKFATSHRARGSFWWTPAMTSSRTVEKSRRGPDRRAAMGVIIPSGRSQGRSAASY